LNRVTEDIKNDITVVIDQCLAQDIIYLDGEWLKTKL